MKKLTRTQIGWLIHALKSDIRLMLEEMDASPDGSPLVACGKVMIDGRKALIEKLTEIKDGKDKLGKID